MSFLLLQKTPKLTFIIAIQKCYMLFITATSKTLNLIVIPVIFLRFVIICIAWDCTEMFTSLNWIPQYVWKILNNFSLQKTGKMKKFMRFCFYILWYWWKAILVTSILHSYKPRGQLQCVYNIEARIRGEDIFVRIISGVVKLLK